MERASKWQHLSFIFFSLSENENSLTAGVACVSGRCISWSKRGKVTMQLRYWPNGVTARYLFYQRAISDEHTYSIVKPLDPADFFFAFLLFVCLLLGVSIREREASRLLPFCSHANVIHHMKAVHTQAWIYTSTLPWTWLVCYFLFLILLLSQLPYPPSPPDRPIERLSDGIWNDTHEVRVRLVYV